MWSRESKRERALSKELLAVEKQEARMALAAQKPRSSPVKDALEDKIPAKAYSGLQAAFCKGFSLVFQQGKGIIEKGFDRKALEADFALRDEAVQRKGGRRELRQVRAGTRKTELVNLAVTTAEGIGLGTLGIGMPDIVLFLGTLLKGIYETALHYGFGYESRQEQLLILKMMAAALSTEQEWAQRNREVDEMLRWETVGISEEEFQQQLKITASCFAVDMLLLKWIQGLPLVGILGGAANPVYYRKVMGYVQLKYRKRYLLKQVSSGEKG